MPNFKLTRCSMAGAIMGTAVLAAGASFASTPAQAADPVTLRFHSHVPPVSSSFKTLKAWADKVEKDSGGRIKIQMFGAMQLGGKAPDVYDQVKNGVVDIGWTLPGYKAGIFPAISVFELPFIAGTAPVISPAVEEFARSVGAPEWKDVHPIVFHYAGASVLHTKDKPVRKMEDFQGLKIRTPSRVSAGALQALGATPVPVPGIATMAEIMMRDVVDGVVTPWGIARAIKVVDVSKYHAENTLHGPTLVLIMNKDSYAKLPDDLKKVIDKNSGAEVSKWLGEQWEINDRPGLEKAKSLGHEVITISPEEEARWRKASQPVYDAWVKEMDAKGLDGAKLLSEAESMIAKQKAAAKKSN